MLSIVPHPWPAGKSPGFEELAGTARSLALPDSALSAVKSCLYSNSGDATLKAAVLDFRQAIRLSLLPPEITVSEPRPAYFLINYLSLT